MSGSVTLRLMGQVLALLVLCPPCCTNQANSTLTIGLLIPLSQEWALGQQAASVIIPAIRQVELLGLLPQYNIDWLMRDTGCNKFTGFRAVVDIWHWDRSVDVLIGPACSICCQYVGLFAAVWNIPIISYFCTSGALSDKNTYSTFARVTNSVRMTAPIAAATLDAIGWRRCTILRTPQEVWSVGAHELRFLLEARGVKTYNHIVQPVVTAGLVDEAAMEDQIHVIEMIKHESRFVFLYMYWEDAGIFLLNAKSLGLLNGEYIFYSFYTADMIDQPLHAHSDYTTEELFTGVFIMEATRPVSAEWHQLTQDILDAFDDPRFDGYQTVETRDEVSHHAGFIYDAVLLWAYALNRTLELGQSKHDGEGIINNTFLFSFSGMTGNVTIDARGDRMVDNDILMLQPGRQLTEVFRWHALEGYLEKVYNPESVDDFSGLIWPGGATVPPSGIPYCGWDGEHCPEEASGEHHISAALFISGIGAFALIALALYFYRRHLNGAAEKEINDCIIHRQDMSMMSEKVPDGGEKDVPQGATLSPGTVYACWIRGVKVHISVFAVDRDITHRAHVRIRKEIKRVRTLSDDNLNPFVGVQLSLSSLALMFEFTHRGNLYDMIGDPSTDLNWDFKNSFIADITRGLSYLHREILGCHGHLTSKDCVIDKRWVCKISNYGFNQIRQRRDLSNVIHNLWTAPEILRRASTGDSAGDVYSFGIIMQEILTDSAPFSSSVWTEEQLLGMVRDELNPPMRPYIDPSEVPREWIDIAQSCWQDNPANRPSCNDILKMVTRLNGGSLPNLVDTMVENLEKHTNKLEGLVSEKSEELNKEREMIDNVLSELLPESVADQMKRGEPIKPEVFNSVTLFFSDIVGFTRVSARSTPLEVVTMLNSLYYQFDGIINMFDVYKFATIGDAYMVGSGVPVRNGDRHTTEIALMSLQMMDAVKTFDIPHLPNEKLHMRIGVHTGSCIAAVTGHKAPRYLLFGETPEIAARLEAGSKAMMIHLSDVTAALLRAHGGFLVKSRGSINIKGLGDVETFWLLGVRDEVQN